MVEHLLILKKNKDLTNEIDKTNRITKDQSFNTEDEDFLLSGHLQKTDENNSIKYNENLLGADISKRSLLSLNSPSIDSINDPEGSISDIPLSEKSKKKKQKRLMEKSNSIDQRKSLSKKRPWYTRIDLTKPILFILFLFLIYLMWSKRDIWIPRLLTSNSRVRQTALRNEQKLNDKPDLSLTKNSSSLSSNQDDIINDNNNINNDQILSDDNNNDDYPTSSNKQTSSQKINLRVRRNKMSFTRDRQTKKRRYSKHKIIDDDEDDDDDDDDDDDNNNDSDKISIEPIILPSSIHSPKKHHHHHHHHRSHEPKIKIPINEKTNVILRPHDDIVEQLTKLIKAHGKNRDILTILKKQTGLNKTKLNRFIYQKDFSVISVDLLISILNSFDSTILIVPK